MDIAALLSEATTLPLPQAAARYAAVGVPVCPCVPGQKRPLTVHGFHDASTDPRTIRAWWVRSPMANIAIPTGAASGIEVVDIDRRPEHSGFSPFERARRAGITAGWAALVRTPSGGIHAYYLAEKDRPQHSWQAPRVHIDFRGDGGYVLAPPSIVGAAPRPAGYAVMATAQRAPVSIDAEILHAFLGPVPATFVSSRRQQPLDVDALARWVAARGEGERNGALFWAACRAAENGVTPEELTAVLGPAAQHAGLPPREVATTIRSALRTTMGRESSTRTAWEHHAPRPNRLDTGPPML
jgi:hypothetical protein